MVKSGLASKFLIGLSLGLSAFVLEVSLSPSLGDFNTAYGQTKSAEKPKASSDEKSALPNIDKGLAALSDKKFSVAAGHFAKGFETKEPDAGFYLGRMFELGLGTKKNMDRAKALYLGSNELGSRLAANRLGMMHLSGNSVVQDFKAALKYFEAAASPGKSASGEIELGDSNAQFNIGSMYWQGIGAPEDKVKAVEWYEMAAAQGSIAANNSLGLAYLEGKGSPVAPKLGYERFAFTANKGNPVGLYQLGLMFEVGFGIDQSDDLAYVHFNLGSARDHPLSQEARERVASKLSAEQLSAAQDLTRVWIDANEDDRAARFYPSLKK